MRPFTRHVGTMAPLPRANVDTDQIIPKQFLKRIERTGYGPHLFHDWARDEPDFVLNRPEYREASVLVTGPNFGCGSSREHAPWGLEDRGFRVIIAPSFADIFRTNCHKIGLLAIALGADQTKALIRLATTDPTAEVTIDLEDQTVSAGEVVATFDIDPHTRQSLLEGHDAIDMTLQHENLIAAFEAKRPSHLPTTRRV